MGVSAAGVHDDTAFARHALESVLRHADGQLTASQEHVVSALTNEQHPLYLDEGTWILFMWGLLCGWPGVLHAFIGAPDDAVAHILARQPATLEIGTVGFR